jgi:quercetin dioxygenase-like cupin family protein
MPGRVHSVPRPIWTAVARDNCRNVEARVLLRQPGLTLVQLRFGVDATIDEHAAAWDIDVVCLEGDGTATLEGVAEPIHAGECIRWPATKRHCLYTNGSTMVTLMVEHVGVDADKR